MESTATYARPELLQVADTVARDKGIDKDEVLEAMEQAIQKAGRSKYGQEYDIRAEIDRRSGEIRLLRFREVVDAVENEATQMPLAAAQRLNAEAEIGDFITDPLPPIDFGRIAAQTAKQVIVQKVRDAERQRQYDEFKDRVGEIVNGLVKRVEFGNVVVDLGRAEAMLRRDELLPRESFRQGERVRAYIYDVRQETRGPQIFLSRTHPQFMAKLFAQEVPEIYDGIIEIKAVARDPGSRAKIAVISRDSGIDPVGACVGMRGSRVQAVVGELQGEKIDIIPWSSDPATFVVNALAPAEVSKVVHGRGAAPHRGRRARRPAQPRDRPARPERAARLAADRLGHRHPDRGRGIGAAHRGIPQPQPDVHRRARHRRRDRPSAGHRRVSARSRRSPMSRSRIWPGSRASTRRSPPSFRSAPAMRSNGATANTRSATTSSASRTIWRRSKA